jgi:hypothetical protein
MAYFPLHTYMAAFMSGFKDGRQVIVPVPLEFTGWQSRHIWLAVLNVFSTLSCIPLKLKHSWSTQAI